MFERQAVEDRAASLEQGRYVAKDIDYAIVTPMGSKDRIPRLVDEWFPYLEVQVRQERFPAEWLRAFKEAYKRWKEDQQMPENGTPISQWPPASPAMVKNMLTWNVRTVEDLAVANEETLSRLGMGARDLKRRAEEWLRSASNVGQSSERISALQMQLDQANAANALLREQLSHLAARVDALAPGKQSTEPAPETMNLDPADLFDPAPPPSIPVGARPL